MLKNKTIPRRPRIGIDLLGADISDHLLFEAILKVPFHQEVRPLFTFFGNAQSFDGHFESSHVSFCIASETIEPGDDPLGSIRMKKNSSMILGIHQLKQGAIDAFITAGNSGSLLAAATLNLSLLPSIERPGFITLMPTKEEPVAVIDVGANIDVKPEHLLQFAKMGIAYQKSRGITHPKVGLLNIGEEKRKGTLKHRQAYTLLTSINEKSLPNAPSFIGNIEGRDVFRGTIDVLVTDGFTGNIFLKTAEGIAAFILDQMQHLETLVADAEMQSIVKRLHDRLYFAQSPGALLCGIEGIVIKCHGASKPEAFIQSIREATHLIQNHFLKKMQTELGVSL